MRKKERADAVIEALEKLYPTRFVLLHTKNPTSF